MQGIKKNSYMEAYSQVSLKDPEKRKLEKQFMSEMKPPLSLVILLPHGGFSNSKSLPYQNFC